MGSAAGVDAQRRHHSIVERLYHRLDMPAVLLGFGLPSDGAHAPNEQFYLPNFFRGVETVLHFIAAYAGDEP